MPQLRAAIIGCGHIAGGFDERSPPDTILTHVKAYLDRRDVSVVGVADPNHSAAQAFARRWGIPQAFPSAEELLGQVRPDLVSICSPNDTHADLLDLCLHYPLKGVWCEKPLAIDPEIARPLVESFKERRIPLLVNYMRRWMDQAQLVRSKLQQGEFGRILHVGGYYTKGLRHNGSHTVDLFRYWFGEPVVVTVVEASADEIHQDRIVDAQFWFEGNVPVQLTGLGTPGYSLWEVDLVATAGRVRFRNSGFDVDWYDVEPSEVFAGHSILSSQPRIVRSDLGSVMRSVLDNLVIAVRTGAPLLSDGASGLKTLELCNELIHQAEGHPA